MQTLAKYWTDKELNLLGMQSTEKAKILIIDYFDLDLKCLKCFVFSLIE